MRIKQCFELWLDENKTHMENMYEYIIQEKSISFEAFCKYMYKYTE